MKGTDNQFVDIYKENEFLGSAHSIQNYLKYNNIKITENL